MFFYGQIISQIYLNDLIEFLTNFLCKDDILLLKLFNLNNCKYTNQSLIYIIFYKIYEIVNNIRKSKKQFFFW